MCSCSNFGRVGNANLGRNLFAASIESGKHAICVVASIAMAQPLHRALCRSCILRCLTGACAPSGCYSGGRCPLLCAAPSPPNMGYRRQISLSADSDGVMHKTVVSQVLCMLMLHEKWKLEQQFDNKTAITACCIGLELHHPTSHRTTTAATAQRAIQERLSLRKGGWPQSSRPLTQKGAIILHLDLMQRDAVVQRGHVVGGQVVAIVYTAVVLQESLLQVRGDDRGMREGSGKKRSTR